MSRTSIEDWSLFAPDNTELNGLNVTGSAYPSEIPKIFREMMAQLAAAGIVGIETTGVLSNKSLSDATTFVVDEADETKKAQFEAAGITTGTIRTFAFPDANGTLALLADIPSLAAYAKLDTEDQTLTGGARVTSKDLGTPEAASTVTLDPGDRPLQHLTNNAEFTLAPGSNHGAIILHVTNGASAGAITTSGWTKVVGAFTTTNAHTFQCACVVGVAGSFLSIQGGQ